MLRKVARLGAVLFAGYAGSAFALGLGEINVASNLNQRFTATIPIFSASANDIDSLQVGLAQPEEFDRAGIERSDYLTSLSFKVQSGPGGPSIVVTSPDIDREPFLSFIVEARWHGGKLLREYTVLLDPPSLNQSDLQAAPVTHSAAIGAATAEPAEDTGESAPVRKPWKRPARPAAAPPTDYAPAPAAEGLPAYSLAGATDYGPVSPKETLWSIGVKLKPASATMDQILLALYSANPGAFDRGRFDGLIKGSTLKVPSEAQVTSVSPETAKARIAALKAGRHLNPGAMSGRPLGAAAGHAPAKAAKPVVTKPVAPPTPPVSEATPAIPPKPLTTPPPPPVAPAPPSSPSETIGQQAPPPATAPATPAATPSTTEPAVTPSPVTPPPSAVIAPATPRPAAPPMAAQPAPPESSIFDGILYPVLALLALFVIVFFGWRTVRKKKAAAEVEEDIPPVPAMMTTARNLSPQAFGTVARAAPPEPPQPPELQTKPGVPNRFDAETLEVKPFSSDSTVRMAETALPMPGARKPGTSAVGGDVDFDLTSQFEASTLAVNLDANDPISEADFHLAYGLYDEAAGLLKQAIAKEPTRNELRAKLCETYFAAGKPMEFQETAESMHGAVPPGEWQKIAIMGRQLCPGSAMFAENSDAQMTEMDLPLEEPPGTAPVASPADFDLGDFTDDAKTVFRPKLPQGAAAPAPAPAKSDNLIDFDLDAELLKGTAGTVLTEQSATLPKASEVPPARTDVAHERDLDLSHFDLANEPSMSGTSETTIDPSAGSVEFNLEELDLGRPVETHDYNTVTDEVSTKLDLARAYSDMGDNEAARSLLHEVVIGGTPAQREEAEALIKRLVG